MGTLVLGVAACATPAPWWDGSGLSACGPPAVYRVDSGARASLGDCAGVFVVPPAVLKMKPGQEVDVHMTESESFARKLAPEDPPPSSSDRAVLTPTGLTDGGSTIGFRAGAPGTAMLTTTALCIDVVSNAETKGQCPVLSVMVVAARS